MRWHKETQRIRMLEQQVWFRAMLIAAEELTVVLCDHLSTLEFYHSGQFVWKKKYTFED